MKFKNLFKRANDNNSISDSDIVMNEIPYFLENKEWYYHDGYIYQLTDKAPKKAIDSYYEWYNDGDDE